MKKKPGKELYYCDICKKLIGEEPWVCHDCDGDMCEDHINKKAVAIGHFERDDDFMGGTNTFTIYGNICDKCMHKRSIEEERLETIEYKAGLLAKDEARKAKRASIDNLRSKLGLTPEEFKLLRE